MKIHTTQNLSSINSKSSTNRTMPMELRLNYSEQMRKHGVQQPSDSNENDSVSFKGKKDIVKVFNKLSKEAVEKEKFNEKNLKPGLFDKVLDLMSHEVFIQGVISFLICLIARPLTIMAIPAIQDFFAGLFPGKKEPELQPVPVEAAIPAKVPAFKGNVSFKKRQMTAEARQHERENNMYASSHSMASGTVSLFSSVLLTVPFSKGAKYAQKTLVKNFDSKILARMYPHLDLKSIVDAAGKRKDLKEWIDIAGNKFSMDYKDVLKMAAPKHITEVSEATLKKLGVDIDLNAMKGKSVNEWVTRDGKKAHFELRDMILAVKEEGMGTNYFSLQHIDKNFLKELYPNLNIESIEKEGKRLHTDYWKNLDGSNFKLDMDNLHISSYNETYRSVPLYTGRTRVESGKKGATKYMSYQSNNGLDNYTRVPDKLGTEIKQSYLDADAANDVHNKLIVWLPDIATRIPVACATIALIPIILKECFGLEKHKHKEEKPQMPPVQAERKEVA